MTVSILTSPMQTKEKDVFGFFLWFAINNVRWQLNYHGDAPLLILHRNEFKTVLQIDGDLYYPLSHEKSSVKNDYEKFELTEQDGLNLLNTMLYEDMELEDEDVALPNEYDLIYEGKNKMNFLKLVQKVAKNKLIVLKDIIDL